MKKRTIALMLSVLAVMMLVGVGFATWVISQGSSTNQTGNLVVETVRDDRLNVTVTAVESGNNGGLYELKESPYTIIDAAAYAELTSGQQEAYEPYSDANRLIFTAPASASAAGDWLTGEDNLTEKTTLVFRVEVSREDNSAFASVDEVNITADLKAGTEDLIPLLGIIEKRVDPAQDPGDPEPDFIAYAKSFKEGTNSTVIQCVITVTYHWGSLLNNENPYDFFNALDINAKLDSATVTAAENAGLKYKGVNLTTDNNNGDFAKALLDKLAAHTSKQVQLTLKVELSD